MPDGKDSRVPRALILDFLAVDFGETLGQILLVRACGACRDTIWRPQQSKASGHD